MQMSDYSDYSENSDFSDYSDYSENSDYSQKDSVYFVVGVTLLDVPPEMVAPVVYEPFQMEVSGLLMLVLP